MTRRVVDLHPQAIAEGREARSWYLARSEGVEQRFRSALRRAIDDIRAAPERWPPDSDDLRHCRVAGFPYRLIYWTDGSYSVIVAIAHARRRPRYWAGRFPPPK
jgi:plasmid stabilization system protein ParE